MSKPSNLDVTQTVEVGFLVSNYAVHHPIPAFLLELVAFGIASTALLIGFYSMLRREGSSVSASLRKVYILVGYAVFAVHLAMAYSAIATLDPGSAPARIGSGVLSVGAIDVFPGYLTLLKMFTTASILFGVSTGLFICTFAVLFKDRSFQRPSKVLLFLTVFLMYTASAMHWSLGIGTWIGNSCHAENLSCNFFHYYTNVALKVSAMVSVNVVLSDAVVLWRACAVWMNHRYIVCFSCLALTATTSITAASLVVLHRVLSSQEEVSRGKASWLFGTQIGHVALGLSIFTNTFATATIAYKTWVHRKFVRNYLDKSSRRLLTEKVLVLFVESGALYIGLWIFYAVNVVMGKNLAYVYTMLQIITIYPTCVILLVSLENRIDRDKNTAQTLSQIRIQPGLVTIATMIQPISEEGAV